MTCGVVSLAAVFAFLCYFCGILTSGAAQRRLDPSDSDDAALLPFLFANPRWSEHGRTLDPLTFSEDELNLARRLKRASSATPETAGGRSLHASVCWPPDMRWGVDCTDPATWFWGCQMGKNPAINTTVREEQCFALAGFFCWSHCAFGKYDTEALWKNADDGWDDGVFCKDGPYYCTWSGVSCDSDGYVLELILPDNCVMFWDEVIPDGLGALSKLEVFDIGPIRRFPGFYSQDDIHQTDLVTLDDFVNSNRAKRLPADFGLLSNLRGVYLGGVGLRDIPSGVLENSSASVAEIDISANPLRRVDGLTGHFPVLQTLDMSYCSLTTFPEVNATALRNLSAAACSLNSLPPHLPSLIPSVELLLLGGNSLKTLSYSSFVGLTGLRTLDLNSNGLFEIPSQICVAATGVRRLMLSANRLSELPDFSLCAMLTHLEANWNPLTSFPTSSLQLQRLRQLRISGAGLTSAPAQILELPSLEELRMDVNSIERFDPPEVTAVHSNLSILSLGGNRLASIPRIISSTLSQLYLDDNLLSDGFFAAQPNYFGELPAIFVLDLSENNLTAFPSSLNQLGNLRYLWARRNHIRSLPEDFGFCFPELCSLNLAENELLGLPESFGNLSRISRLTLASNRLQQLPENFGYHGSDPGYGCDLWRPLGESGHMRTVGLRKNALTALPSSFADFFLHNVEITGFPLMLVDLSFNPIDPIPSFDHAQKVFVRPDGSKVYMGSLTLFLDSMNLTSLPSDFGLDTRFSMLSLAENSLESLPDCLYDSIALSNAMGALDLSGNRFRNVSSLDFHSRSYLSRLSLDGNLLEDWGMPSTVPTRYLDIFTASGNKLETMPSLFSEFNRLRGVIKVVDFSDNAISRMPFPTAPIATNALAQEGNLERMCFWPPHRLFVSTEQYLSAELSNNPFWGGLYLGGSYESLGLKGMNVSRLWYPLRLLSVDFGDNENLRSWPEDTGNRDSSSGSAIAGTLDEFFCESPEDFRSLEILGVEDMPNLVGSLPSCLDQFGSLYLVRAENNGPDFGAASQSTELRFGAVERVSGDEARDHSVGSAGTNLGPLQFGTEFVADMNLQASCPSVVIQDVPTAIVEVEPSYYGRSMCACDKLYCGDATSGSPCVACSGEDVICPVSGLYHPLPAPGYWPLGEPPFRSKRCRANDAGGRTACSNVLLVGPLGHFDSSEQFYGRMRDTAGETKIAQWCDEGYEGTLCSRCESGYYLSGGSRCVQCPIGAGGLAFLYVLLILFVFFVLCGLGYAATSSWTREWRVKRELAASVRAREDLRIGTLRRLKGISSTAGRELREVEVIVKGDNGSADENSDRSSDESEDDLHAKVPRRSRAEFITSSTPEHIHVQSEAATVKELKRRSRRPFVRRKQLLGVSTLVFHFQMVNLLTRIGTGLFSFSILSGEGLACFNFQLGSPECYFPGWGFFETFLTAILTPIWQTLLVFPIVGIAFGLYIWGQARRYVLVTLLKVAWRRQMEWVARAREVLFGVPRSFVFFLRRCAYILFFLYFQSYMSVTPLVLQALRCSRVSEDAGSIRYLMAAPYFRCDSSDGKYVAMVVLASLYFVFWVIGLPVLFFFGTMLELREFEFLFRIYRAPRASRVERTMEIGQLFKKLFSPQSSLDSRESTHVLQTVYKYWEVWKVFLRLLVAMVIAFVDVDSAFVPFLLIILFAIAAVLQSTFRPHVRRYDTSRGQEMGRKSFANELEFSSFMIIIANFTCALVTKIPHVSNVTAVGVLLVILNVLFLLLGAGVILRSPIFSTAIFVGPVALFHFLSVVVRNAMRLFRTLSERKPADEEGKVDEEEEEEFADAAFQDFERTDEVEVVQVN